MIILFIVGFIVNVSYLLCLAEIFKRLKNNNKEYWNSIGSPEIFDPSSGIFVIRRMFGSDMTKICERINSASLLIATRFLFVVGVSFVVIISFLILSITPQRT